MYDRKITEFGFCVKTHISALIIYGIIPLLSFSVHLSVFGEMVKRLTVSVQLST